MCNCPQLQQTGSLEEKLDIDGETAKKNEGQDNTIADGGPKFIWSSDNISVLGVNLLRLGLRMCWLTVPHYSAGSLLDSGNYRSGRSRLHLDPSTPPQASTRCWQVFPGRHRLLGEQWVRPSKAGL